MQDKQSRNGKVFTEVELNKTHLMTWIRYSWYNSEPLLILTLAVPRLSSLAKSNS
jgi:hypothetical protein